MLKGEYIIFGNLKLSFIFWNKIKLNIEWRISY
jgi:hypothetical protein